MERELQLKGHMLLLVVVSMEYDTRDDVWFCERVVCLLLYLTHEMNFSRLLGLWRFESPTRSKEQRRPRDKLYMDVG